MNQEPENKITDHELDDMLRRVQVPADLKDRLLKIPHTVQQDQPRVELPDTASPEPQHTRWLPYVLVATLLIIAGIVATQWLPDDATNTPNVIATKQNDNNEPSEYTVELGGSKTDLKSEMALVQEKFPQSRGADLAQQILQQLN